MSAAPLPTLRTAALIAALVPCTVLAQVQPQGAANPNAGMLTPTTPNAAAVTELRSSLDRYNLWTNRPAVGHANRALELEPAFGLARTVRAIIVGGPTTATEFQQAVTEASTASAGEILLALSAREVNAGRAPIGRRMSQTAAELLPNDRQVAAWRAIQLPDTQRTKAFREVASRFPDYPGARMWLANFLTTGFDSNTKANADEALRAAMEAVRLAPNESGTHTAVAHVLIFNGRIDEAKGHLAAATKMAPVSEYAYELLAQIATVESNLPALRAALDSAAASTPSIGGAFAARRYRAMIALAEGNPQAALADIAQQAKEAEAINARGQIQQSHFWMAFVAAATRDSAAVEQHLAAARSYEPAPAPLADAEVIAYSVAGIASGARRALNDYTRISGPQPNLSAGVNAARTINLHRMTGLVLVAEKKPQEAIAELRQGGNNPYATLGIIEAYKQLKNNKQADAERTAFFARKEFSYASSATPIIRYRAKK